MQPGVAYNAPASQLESALNGLPGLSQAIVHLVGDTDYDGTVDNFGHPYAGSFEALILGTEAADHSMADIIATHNFTGGNNPDIVVQTLLQGGSDRFKTSGRNQVAEVSPNETRLYTDFDDGTSPASTFGDGLGQGANEAHGTWGDSGSPLIIGGKIAGVLEGLYTSVEGGFSSGGGYDSADPTVQAYADRGSSSGSGDFGEIDSWARVSYHQAWINSILDDPFDLVLNMENQPWGGDNIDDTIEVSRVSNMLQIRIGGVLYYSESMDLIESVTIRGSSDNDTIIVSALGDGVPLTINGRGGHDVIRLDGLSDAVATLFGENGDDTFIVGDGDFASNVVGSVFSFGGDSDDMLLIDDHLSSGNHEYTLEADDFTMSSYPGQLFYWDFENVHLQANCERPVEPG